MGESPVQYMVRLLDQGKTVEDAYLHAMQHYGYSRDELSTLVLQAREEAKTLIDRSARLV